MRVAKMPYLQLVKGKYRVRMVVPPELQPIIGKANLTKWLGTGNEPEANRLSVPWIAKFQETIDTAAGRTTVLEELRRLDMLSYPGFIQQAPTVLTKLDKPLNGWLYDIVGEPAGMAKTEPVTFDFIIEKWAANTNAPKRGKQDKTTKANRFATWLGHNDMANVTFEECRDYRDSLVKEAKEDKMSFTSAKQHMKHLKALFAFACDDIHIPADPMARVKLRFGGDGEKPADFTREDRRLILTLARESGNPAIYWLNWLGSFEGARLCELAEADTRDIVMQDGIWIIGVKRVIRIAEQGAKTTRSPRDLPLHSAVLDAKPRFFDYVDYVKDKFGEGPLLPQFNLDGYEWSSRKPDLQLVPQCCSAHRQDCREEVI
jgi:hypothetical protein